MRAALLAPSGPRHDALSHQPPAAPPRREAWAALRGLPQDEALARYAEAVWSAAAGALALPDAASAWRQRGAALPPPPPGPFRLAGSATSGGEGRSGGEGGAGTDATTAAAERAAAAAAAARLLQEELVQRPLAAC